MEVPVSLIRSRSFHLVACTVRWRCQALRLSAIRVLPQPLYSHSRQCAPPRITLNAHRRSQYCKSGHNERSMPYASLSLTLSLSHTNTDTSTCSRCLRRLRTSMLPKPGINALKKFTYLVNVQREGSNLRFERRHPDPRFTRRGRRDWHRARLACFRRQSSQAITTERLHKGFSSGAQPRCPVLHEFAMWIRWHMRTTVTLVEVEGAATHIGWRLSRDDVEK